MTANVPGQRSARKRVASTADSAARSAAQRAVSTKPIRQPVKSQPVIDASLAAHELATLLDDITSALTRYVIFGSEHDARAIALYIVSTHVRDADNRSAFWITPYLYIRNRNAAAAKSLILQLVMRLIHDPSHRMVRPTEASLFRLIHDTHRTIIIDEIHLALKGNEAEGIIGVLDGGFEHDGTFPRIDMRTGHTVDFNIDGHKIIAGLNVNGLLPDTTLTRCVIIDTVKVRKAREKLGVRFKPQTWATTEAPPLHARCVSWAAKYHTAVISASEPEFPAEIDDRSADAWECLFTIAELAGPEWAKYGREAALHLCPTEDDETGNALDAGSFDTWVKTAFERQIITAGDYNNRHKPPALCTERDVDIKLFGWPASRSFTAVSVKTDTTHGDTLRIAAEDFPRFWKAVQRANQNDRLPESMDMRRELRAAGRLIIDGPRALTRKERTWHNQPKRDATVIIQISEWYSAPAEPKSAELVEWENLASDAETINETVKP